MGEGAVVVEGALRVDADGAAGDGQVAVGINAVGVPLAHGDAQLAPVDLYAGGVGGGLSGAVDAVVAGTDGDFAVVDLDPGALDALGGGDVDAAAVDLDDADRVEAVVRHGDIQRAAADVDPALPAVVLVLRVEAVLLAAGDGDGAVRQGDAVVGLDAVIHGADGQDAAGDLDLVLAADAVVGGADRQTAQAVEDQIVPAEDHRVGVGGAVGSEGAGDGEAVFAALGGGDEDLVGVLHVDHGAVVVGDAQTVQHQLHLVLISRVYHDGDVLRAAREHVDPLGGDGDILAVGDGIGDGLAQIGALGQIPLGEELGGVHGAARGDGRGALNGSALGSAALSGSALGGGSARGSVVTLCGRGALGSAAAPGCGALGSAAALGCGALGVAVHGAGRQGKGQQQGQDQGSALFQFVSFHDGRSFLRGGSLASVFASGASISGKS